MSKPLVSIITGNSNSGKWCIKELFGNYADKVRVRGVFRSEEKAKPFRDEYPKLELVTDVDASQVESLDKAFERADYALIVTPHDPKMGFANDASLTENMINSAVRNGVRYIVLVTSWSVHHPNEIKIISSRFIRSERLIERLGNQTGLKWTVLRGGSFMENSFFLFKDSIKNSSTINYPEIHCAWVDTRDIGKSAAACFTSANIDQHHGKYYEMNGPQMLGGEELAALFSKVLGREIKLNKWSREMCRKVFPEPIAELFEFMIDKGVEASPFNDDVLRLTGQNGTFEQFLIENKHFFS